MQLFHNMCGDIVVRVQGENFGYDVIIHKTVGKTLPNNNVNNKTFSNNIIVFHGSIVRRGRTWSYPHNFHFVLF